MDRFDHTSFVSSDCKVVSGKCVLIENGKRFAVVVGYNPHLIEVFRSIPSKRYDPSNKQWDFDIKDHANFMRMVSKLKPEVDIIGTLSTETKTNPFRVHGTCKLITRDRFVIEVTYNEKLNNIFKSISSRVYDAELRRWSFSCQHHDELVKAIRSSGISVSIDPIPTWIMSFISKYVPPDRENLNLNWMDANLRNELLPFQKDGVRMIIANKGRFLLADDMGLGKTIQALSACLYYKNEWPLLVITPSSVKFAWKDQILKWLTEFSETDICVVNSGRAKISMDYAIIIISYDTLTRNAAKIKQLDFKVIIVDESHFLKNYKTARCKATLPILKQAKRVVLLTGTPALSRPSELFPQLHALHFQTFRNFHDFGQRYCGAKESPWGWDYSGCTNMKELQIILDSGIMLRREKSDVLEQLPSKVREMIILDPSLVNSKSSKLNAASRGITKHSQNPSAKRSAFLLYFHETAVAKAKAVSQYVSDCLESTKKFIVFAHHQSMLDVICETCESQKAEYIKIDGSINSERRQFLVKKFHYEDNVRIAVLSVMAASTGINLTAASLVLFAELFWNPGILVQAEDRAYRIGQRDSVLVQYLIAQGTSDDFMWPLIQKKFSVLNSAGLSKDNFKNTDRLHAADGGMNSEVYKLLDEYMMEEEDRFTDMLKKENTLYDEKKNDCTMKPHDAVMKQPSLFEFVHFADNPPDVVSKNPEGELTLSDDELLEAVGMIEDEIEEKLPNKSRKNFEKRIRLY